MNESTARERDLVLAPNQQAFILDKTKGHVAALVGPYKTSLADSDQPVVYNPKTRRFDRVELAGAVAEWPSADEGDYIELRNPAPPDKDQHPSVGNQTPTRLQTGRKVNIPGPVTFPLWPGQVAQVIPGHCLRSDEYLIVRVYNEDEAQKNWAKVVLKPATGSVSDGSGEDTVKPKYEESERSPLSFSVDDLIVGKLLVVCGDQVSFFIPPTGMEVIPQTKGNGDYTRKAVTLERLEYCVLLDETGSRRYVRGPKVVFPKPTETFVVDTKGERKYRAIELNKDMGLHVKVIADYTEGGTTYSTGQELFITGADQQIYFPREEHAIVSYDSERIHYGVAIPEGEARYVLDKSTGSVNLKEGPALFLADPRNEVIVRRILDPRLCRLMYPLNEEALAHNERLSQERRSPAEHISSRESSTRSATSGTLRGDATDVTNFAGDDFRRKTSHTPPRTITLDNKYEGAVTMNIWTGYAVLLVDRSGSRRVELGPKTVLLRYDEQPQILHLSTNKPKSTDTLFSTAYLRVSENYITDIVKVLTADMVEVDLKLSWKVNFEGSDPVKWFNVENYVKQLCDHTRSILRGICRKVKIDQFFHDNVSIIRDAILGKKEEGAKARRGLVFESNEMRVYDVEVLAFTICNKEIADLFNRVEYDAVKTEVELNLANRRLEATKQTELIKRQAERETVNTALQKFDLDVELSEKRAEATLASLEGDIKTSLFKFKSDLQLAQVTWEKRVAEQAMLDEVEGAELSRRKHVQEADSAHEREMLAIRLEELRAEANAIAEKAKAVSPQMVAALQAFSDRLIASKAVESMAPMSLLGGKSVTDILRGVFAGTMLEKALPSTGANGGSHPAITPDTDASKLDA